MAKRKPSQVAQGPTPPEAAAVAAGEPFYESPPEVDRGANAAPLAEAAAPLAEEWAEPHYTDGRACDADMRLSAAKLVAKHLRVSLDAAKRTIGTATERQVRLIMRQQLAEHPEVEIRQVLEPGG